VEKWEFEELTKALKRIEHQEEEQTKLLRLIACLLANENPSQPEAFLPPTGVSVEAV
jgi:hypothetical protein